MICLHLLANRYNCIPYYIYVRCVVSSLVVLVVAAIGGVVLGGWWCPPWCASAYSQPDT